MSQTDLSARAAAILARLEELRSVCEAATGAPWEWSSERLGLGSRDGGRVTLLCSNTLLPPQIEVRWRNEADPLFTVSARTALPILVAIGIAEMQRAQALLEDADVWMRTVEAPKIENCTWWELAGFILDRRSQILENGGGQ